MRLVLLGSGSYKSSLSIRLAALARHLAQAWEVTMIVPGADKYNGFSRDPNVKLPGVRVVQPWQFATKSAMVNLIPYLFTSLLALCKARPQLVYLYKPTPITILGLIPRLLGVPVILDLDDLGSEVMKLEGQPKLQYSLVAWCERLALRYASAVVVTSTYLQTLVLQRYPHKKVLLLSNGVEPADYTIAQNTAVRPAIYYFGALNRLELIESLLRAIPEVIRQVPEVVITIAGGGSAQEAAKALAEELGIAHAIKFTGWIKMLEVQRYVQFADIAICCQPDIPTVRAASIMKVFQYMAMGSVPVVSDVGDLAQYVQYGQAGAVVAADNTAELTATIVGLLQDPARRVQLATTAYHLAQNEYSWQNLTNRLTALLETYVTAKPGKAKL